jgi:hypothetical protein
MMMMMMLSTLNEMKTGNECQYILKGYCKIFLFRKQTLVNLLQYNVLIMDISRITYFLTLFEYAR